MFEYGGYGSTSYDNQKWNSDAYDSNSNENQTEWNNDVYDYDNWNWPSYTFQNACSQVQT